jgi:hypothetical protein
MITLPSFHDQSSDFNYEVDIGGIAAKIRLTWNVRVNHWFMSVTDSQGGAISGIKVVSMCRLLQSHRAFSNLSGDLVVLATSPNASGEITYDNWNVDWVLCWLTDDEIIEWETAYGLR